MYNVAVCDKALGRYLSAIDALQKSRATASSAPRSYLDRVDQTIAVLEAKLAHLEIRVNVPAEILLDGNPIEAGTVVADPGAHVVEARRDGYRAARVSLELAEASRRTVHLELTEAPRPEPLPPAPAVLKIATSDVRDEVFVDGSRQPNHRVQLRVDPGSHHVQVERPHANTRELDLLLRPGEVRELKVTLREPKPRPSWPWIAGGVGALVVASGILVGVLAATRSTEYVGATPGALAPGVVTATFDSFGAP